MSNSPLEDPFGDDPLRDFYNLDGFTSFALTCDIDWAPDYAVEHLLSLVEPFGFPIAAFATHASPALAGAPDWVEVGLHPDNTRPHPEHRFARKILDLKEIYPSAVGHRAHRNFFGQNVAQDAAAAGLTYDASVLLWRQPFAQAYRDQYGLVRFCYVWEDGIHADMGEPWRIDRVPLLSPGLKILNVHPMFQYLNCPDDDHRRAATCAWPDLTQAPRSAMMSQRFAGYGAGRFFEDLLHALQSSGARAVRLKDLASAYGSR